MLLTGNAGHNPSQTVFALSIALGGRAAPAEAGHSYECMCI